MICKRDDGSEVEVDYTINGYGYASNGWDDPGEGAEVTIDTVEDEDGNEVELTDAERERIEQEIAQIVYAEGPPDDPDW